MPPLRNFTPVKITKTERTHEENQERAYIAASRRNDRSLEARVESARRASEIHKKRTGRSLRVTEQDVINEEMYEEEDDDLPSQYRRLTAHLQTGSADFNRRLAAYLANNVAMRSALDQAITSSYAQQFPNARQFAHNHPVMFPSPLLPQGEVGSPQAQQQDSPSSPHPYRQSPYPMPGTPGYRLHSQNQRTGSMTANDTLQKPKMSLDARGRRKSVPTPVLSPTETQQSSSNSPLIERALDSQNVQNEPHQQEQTFGQTYPHSISPLTTTLPADSQLLLGPALDQSFPFNAMLMGSNDPNWSLLNSDFYGPAPKEDNFYPSLDGMNTTLAPSASQLSQSSFTSPGALTGQNSATYDQFGLDAFKGSPMGNISGCSSGNVTPGIDGSWEAFIDENGPWAENAT